MCRFERFGTESACEHGNELVQCHSLNTPVFSLSSSYYVQYFSNNSYIPYCLLIYSSQLRKQELSKILYLSYYYYDCLFFGNFIHYHGFSLHGGFPSRHPIATNESQHQVNIYTLYATLLVFPIFIIPASCQFKTAELILVSLSLFSPHTHVFSCSCLILLSLSFSPPPFQFMLFFTAV